VSKQDSRDQDGPYLFELPEPIQPEPKIKPLRHPIWTENKAKLIERYLCYFVLITKHGTYIDGFAGPQEPNKPEMWAAKLVLESEPKRLRHFHFYDIDHDQTTRLKDLKRSQPSKQAKEPKRDIQVHGGDFNIWVHRLLNSRTMREKEACFCLLDQRTFECHWSTLEALATYKREGHKIELFYFLMNHWSARTFAAQKDTQVLKKWWGREDWDVLRQIKAHKRVELFVDRFKADLGYKSVKPWPIYKRENGGTVMYYMIHATDHPAAPGLMYRAYHKAILPKESQEQLAFEFEVANKNGF
jgi:three-Cys-motif partner protein